HGADAVRGGTGGRADAAVVEGDDAVLRGDAVDDPGVPVVEDRGQVGEEHHGDVRRRAEFTVGEGHPVGGDGAGRCGPVRRRRSAARVLVRGHGVALLGVDLLWGVTRGQVIVTMTLPLACPLSTKATASFVEMNGKTRSMTGRMLPAS